MDLLTNDLAMVRLFLSTNGAPADYVLPKALEQTPLVGTGRLSWQGQPVSLICFERPPTNMLFLFVANRAAMPGGASTTPQFVRINKLMTASWTRGNNLYLLADAGDESGLLPYLE